MSTEDYNNFGVPHYAHPATPARRSKQKPIRQPSEGDVSRMVAHTFTLKQIKENWKEGDRFTISTDRETHRLSTHAGQSGKFVELKLYGNVWWVLVEWFDGYRPKYVGSKLSMFDFYRNAEKLEDDGE